VNIPLYLSVLLRFKYLVAAGLVLACVLAFFSFFRISDGAITPRASEEWVAYTRVLVTENDFDLGRLQNTPEALQSSPVPTLTTLALIYAQLVDSDPVRQLMLRDGPIEGEVEVAAVPAAQGSDEALPILSIAGIADTPEKAAERSSRQARAFQQYLVRLQEEDNVPESQRVQLSIVQQTEPELLSGRSVTLPIAVFLAVVVAVVGLAFLLENLRPRPAAGPQAEAGSADGAVGQAGASRWRLRRHAAPAAHSGGSEESGVEVVPRLHARAQRVVPAGGGGAGEDAAQHEPQRGRGEPPSRA
jgi:capsular polysaccharide biosynthesis protein